MEHERRKVIINVEELKAPQTTLFMQHVEMFFRQEYPDFEAEIRECRRQAGAREVEEALRYVVNLSTEMSAERPDAFLCIHVAAATVEITRDFEGGAIERDCFLFLAMASACRGEAVNLCMLQTGRKIIPYESRGVLSEKIKNVRDERIPDPPRVTETLVEQAHHCCLIIREACREMALALNQMQTGHMLSTEVH